MTDLFDLYKEQTQVHILFRQIGTMRAYSSIFFLSPCIWDATDYNMPVIRLQEYKYMDDGR